MKASNLEEQEVIIGSECIVCYTKHSEHIPTCACPCHNIPKKGERKG